MIVCPKCGKVSPENSTFCGGCGQRIDIPEYKGNSAQNNAGADTRNGNSQQEMVQQQYAQISIAQNGAEQKQKKIKDRSGNAKKGFPKILFIPAGILLVAVLGVVAYFVFPSVKNKIKRTFLSDVEYYKYIERDALESITDATLSFIDSTGVRATGSKKDEDTNSLKKKVSVGVDVSKEAYDRLEDYLDRKIGYDASYYRWVQKANASLTFEMYGDMARGTADVSVNDVKLDNCVDVIFDSKKGRGYLGFPAIYDKYARADMESSWSIRYTLRDLTSINGGSIYSELPESSAIKEVAMKYADICLNHVKNVKMKDTSISINGVKQSCLEMKVNFDEDDVSEIVGDILTELKDEEIVIDYIKNIDNAIKAQYKALYPDESYYGRTILEDYKDWIKDELSWIDKGRAGFDPFELITWVDGSGRILGIQVIVEEDDGLCMRYAYNGKKVAAEVFTINKGDPDVEVLSITGTLDGSKVNGTMTINTGRRYKYTYYDDYYNDYDYTYEETEANIEFRDIDVISLLRGGFSGKIVSTAEEFLDNAYSLGASERETERMREFFEETGLDEAQFVLDLNYGKDKYEIKASVEDKKATLASTVITIENGVSEGIEPPENVKNVDSSDEFSEFWGKMDWKLVRDKLKEAGAPSDIYDVEFSDLFY